MTYDPLIVESHSLTLYYPVLCCSMLLKHASQGSAESPIMSVRTFPSSEDHANIHSSSQLRYRSYFKPFLTFPYISLSEHLPPPFEYTILFHSTLTTTRLNYNLSGQLEIILCNYRPMSQTPICRLTQIAAKFLISTVIFSCCSYFHSLKIDYGVPRLSRTVAVFVISDLDH